MEIPPASSTPAFYRFGVTSKMSIAWSEFAEGVANADNRSAIKHIGGHPLVFHPAPVDNTVFVLAAKPIKAS
jgi:hypothetical protein